MAQTPEEDCACGPFDTAQSSAVPGAKVWPDADGVHVDVRSLPAPWPLVEILRLMDSNRHDGVIIAHLPRDPVHLYPHLAERGWTATQIDGDPGEFRVRLQGHGASCSRRST